MWKKALSCALAVLMAVLLFAACAPEETTLTLPVDTIPASCDPAISDTVAMSTVAANCFEGLVRIDEKGNVQPGAADERAVAGERHRIGAAAARAGELDLDAQPIWTPRAAAGERSSDPG